jgi:uncharacterized protein (DUF934 family)
MPDPSKVVIAGSIGDGGRVVADDWLAVDTPEGLHAADDDAQVLVAHTVWASSRDALVARTAPVGIRLEASDDAAAIAPDLRRFALIAIDFPKFTDGRGYSIARLLRERHGYAGPLRAVGDVLRDQMFYMLRCGFDEFALKHAEQRDDALKAYRDFSEAYQTSVDRPVPLFARRAAADPGATA